jgi:hypothetical protein
MRLMIATTFAVLSVFAVSASAQSISATEAASHMGEHATVCGTIAGEHTATNSRGTPTFINLDKPYPHQVFTILIWGDERNTVGDFPETGRVCATGRITEYHGVPEIVLHDLHNWYVPK